MSNNRKHKSGFKTVNAYLFGKLLATDLVKIGLNENKFLDDVKKEFKEIYPEIEFRIEPR